MPPPHTSRVSHENDEIDYTNPPFPLTAIDRALLAMTDRDFHEITWADLQSIIAANTLEELKRRPSDLRKYLAWSHKIKAAYGSITNFVVRERLRWEPIAETQNGGGSRPPRFEHVSNVPFEDERDYVVLENDWPYGFAPGIRHLLVWTKTPIQVDDMQGDVTDESRRLIEEFIERYFARRMGEHGRKSILWFKNWVSLQSVRGVDHIHVLVRDAPDDLVQTWIERSSV